MDIGKRLALFTGLRPAEAMKPGGKVLMVENASRQAEHQLSGRIRVVVQKLRQESGIIFALFCFLPKRVRHLLYTRERPTDIGLRHAILVIEDNRDGRESLKQLLEALGHIVRVADTGPEGVRLALEFEPDLAIIDIGLPGFDGFEVARRIRRTLGHSVRLIANTGYDSPFFRHEAESAGFDEYTVKPALTLELRRWLG